MANNDWKRLTDSLAAAWSSSSNEVLGSMSQSLTLPATTQQARTDVETLAQRAAEMGATAEEERAQNQRPPRTGSSGATASSDAGSGSSTATEVLKTVGMV